MEMRRSGARYEKKGRRRRRRGERNKKRRQPPLLAPPGSLSLFLSPSLPLSSPSRAPSSRKVGIARGKEEPLIPRGKRGSLVRLGKKRKRGDSRKEVREMKNK
jgi:hypothetical protein